MKQNKGQTEEKENIKEENFSKKTQHAQKRKSDSVKGKQQEKHVHIF